MLANCCVWNYTPIGIDRSRTLLTSYLFTQGIPPTWHRVTEGTTSLRFMYRVAQNYASIESSMKPANEIRFFSSN